MLTLTTRRDLIAAVEEGLPVKYLFFWGHTEPAGGRISETCLSQWYPLPFEVDGVRYPTAEHFMMAGKARLFGDDRIRDQIVAAASPGEAKKLGRRVANFDQALWNAERFAIVVRGNVAKFGADERLRDYLLGTGERVLVEASPRDRIWGIGMGKSNPNATDPRAWRGSNLLGFALMEARRLLKEEGAGT